MTVTTLPRRAPPGVIFKTDAAALTAFVASHREPVAPPLAIACPTTESEVGAVIQWANQHGVALVPVSSPGGPRRRGDTQPKQAAVALDLSGMRRMIHADGADRIAVIEPGLTFRDFDEALQPHGLRSFKPLLPRRSKSVLATYLEREPTISPNDHWDSSDPLAALSFHFGSGEPFRTGGASLPGTLDDNLKRGNRQMMASGPLMTDYTRVLLGSQGTLGVVSWGSIYCEAIPAREEARLYGADDYCALAELARLLMLRQLGAQCFILDRHQLAAALADTPAAFESLRGSSCPPWVLYVNVTATDYLPDQRMAWQLKDLAMIADSTGASTVTGATGISAQALAQRLQQPPATYFKDTPRGAHREVFCISQLDKVSGLLAQVDPLLRSAEALGDIVCGIYVQPMVQGVSCHLEFTLMHAPSPSAAEAATRLERELVQRLAQAGGFFSRPYGAWAEVAYGRDPVIAAELRKVKQIFDPKGLLNPGQLCF